MSATDDATILQFVVRSDPDDDRPLLSRKRRSYAVPECPHRHKEIDLDLRRVVCLDCGQTLDPIECLLGFEAYIANARHRLETVKAYHVKELEQAARALARRHPLTREGAVIPGDPRCDPGLTQRRYESAKEAARNLPLADRLGLLVSARVLAPDELTAILDRMAQTCPEARITPADSAAPGCGPAVSRVSADPPAPADPGS